MLQKFQRYWTDESDPRVESYFLFNGGPELFAVIMFSWLLFVLKLGPHLMKDRKPFVLREVMIVFNLALVIINTYLVYESIKWLDYGRKVFQFKIPDRSDTSEQTLWEIRVKIFLFYTKLLELLDTIFFVLRKKSTQLSFLHVYHHFIVPVLVWLIFKWCIQSCIFDLFVTLNSSVHVVMYSYYCLSSFGPAIQKYLWWKRYITELQITQFVILIIYAVYGFMFYFGDHTYYPLSLTIIVPIQPFIFFYLFYRFNAQTYRRETKSLKTN